MSARDLINIVTIHDVELVPIEHEGRRVLTMAMMDAVHQRPDGTARRNFNEHKRRLIAGEDYYELNQPDEIRTLGLTRPQGGTPASVVVLTETGYSMLVKSFTDDLAWEVQRQLVKSYFAKASPSVTFSDEFVAVTQALRLTPMAVRAARALGLDANAAAISANQLIVKVTGQNVLAAFGQTHLIAERQDTQWFTPTELGSKAKLTAVKVNQLLASAGFQVKNGKVWELLDAGRPFARLFDTGKKHDSGVPVQQIKWSPAAIDVARKAGGKGAQPVLL